MNTWRRTLMMVLPMLMLLALVGRPSSVLAVTPQVAAGGDFTISLDADGTLWASGTNSVGQLGIGPQNLQQLSRVQIGSGTNWAAVAAGVDHAVALRADGTLWAWGSNQFGQLGTTPGINQSAPVQVGSDSTWTAVSAGAFFTVALKADGTLWSWGLNNTGQLGNGGLIAAPATAPADQPAPVPVLNLGLSRYVAVSAGGEHVLALQADGSLWSWGSNQFGQLGNGTIDTLPFPPHSTPAQVLPTGVGWTAISGGGVHSAALRADGTLWTWGRNNFGQLGDGTGAVARPAPVQVAGPAWARVSAGDLHTVAVTRTGAVYAWGNNANGQLGAGIGPDTLSHPTPLLISNPPEMYDLVAVAAGPGHSLALKATGEVFVWGENATGSFGDGTTASSTIPVLARQNPTSWVGAGPGVLHAAARRSDGSLWAWGDNFLGQLGLDPLVATGATTPVMIANPATWVTQSGGLGHTLAVRPNGTLWSWGDNSSGQLGSSPAEAFLPTQVTATNDWVTVAAGDFHSVALKADGTLWAWGDNTSLVPTQVLTPGAVGNFDSNWVAVAASGDYSLAIQADGTLWGWGSNSFGQLGLDPVTTPTITAPTQLVNFNPPAGNPGFNSNWRAVAAGFQHMLGLQADGTVWALGANTFGQLGNTVDTAVPPNVLPVGTGAASFNFVQVINADPAIPYVAIAAGDSHSVARRADGTIWSWGNNTSGQLASGPIDPPIDFNNPVYIPHSTPLQESSAARDWVTVSAGGGFTLALKGDGTISAWGDNSTGQLGDGTTINRGAPTALLEPRIQAPSAISFGSVPLILGPFTPQPLTIRNTGTSDLVISAVTKLNDPLNRFVYSAGDCVLQTVLAPGGSCTASVTFTPVAPVAYAATLNIVSNDPLKPAVIVNLSGTGVNPYTITAAVDPASPAGSGTVSPLGAVLVAPGAAQSFVVSPNAAGGFGIGDIVVDGISRGAADNFTFSNVTANHTITVSFTATRAITASAGSGGVISPTGSVLVNVGANRMFTITPDFGFSIADVKINGTVSVLNQMVNNTYTFFNVQDNATISATFVAEPINKWHWRNPLPQGLPVRRIATDGLGNYVAVGDYGTILTSADSSEWTVRTSGSLCLNGVAYGNGTYVVVGTGGRVLRSTDGGATWATQSSGTAANLYGVAYNGSVFVAVGATEVDANPPFVPRSVILTSSNGVTWVPHFKLLPLGQNIDLFDVASGAGGKLAAVGSGGTIMTSIDNGSTWTTAPEDLANRGAAINAITYGNGAFVAVGDFAQITTSYDNGTSWTPRSAFSVADLKGVGFGAIEDPQQPGNTVQVFTAVGTDGEILTSEDLGSNWSNQISFLAADGAGPTLLAATVGLDKSLVPNVNHIIIAGEGGNILMSPDETIWINRLKTATRLDLRGAAQGNGLLVAVGGQGATPLNGASAVVVSSSDNGLNWISQPLPAGVQPLNGVAYGNGVFVAVGASSYNEFANAGGSASILTSTDGITWTSRSSGSFLGLNGITFANGRFIAVGDYNIAGGNLPEGAAMLVSTDGISWTFLQKSTATAGNLKGVAFGTIDNVGDTLVAVGEFGTVLFSIDNGGTWQESVADPIINYTDLNAVAFGAGTYRAVGITNEVFSSSDHGTTWSSELLPIPTTLTVNFQSIAYLNGLFAAAGNDDFIVSKNGPGGKWIVNMGAEFVNSSLFGIAAANGSLLAVGKTGTILQSDPLAGALPLINVSPTAKAFAGTLVGLSSAPQVVTLRNNGDSALNVGTIALDGNNVGDFVVSNDSCSSATLAPLAECTVQVAFTPLVPGGRSAILAIPSNDPYNAVVNVELSGAGIESFLLTVTNAGNGSGSVGSNPAGITIVSGTSGFSQSGLFAAAPAVVLTATPDPSSVFTGWSGTGAGACAGTTTPCTVTVNAARSVVATFTLKQLTLTTAAGSNGTISPPGPVTVNYGSNHTFTFNPAPGYAVLDVLVDLVSQGAVPEFTFNGVAADHQITVSFSPAPAVRLTTQAAPNTYSTITAALAGVPDNGSAVIDAQAVVTTDAALTVGRGINLKLTGGYGAGFAGNAGMTTIPGKVTVSSGKLIISNIVIR